MTETNPMSRLFSSRFLLLFFVGSKGKSISKLSLFWH